MPEAIKSEAKDFVATGIEKASGMYGVNIDVRTFSLLTLC